ncbi:MAG TPA: alpha-amylase family glycosyl hydrolase [Gaiellaceae bacterium]|nr:alpha-amylase family glycosyl hydrolase [Gaiellaceae bacterium]
MAAALAALVFVALASGAAPRPPAPPSGATLALLSQPPTRLALASDRIYSVITDRYANGEPANDTGGITGDKLVTGFDPADAAYFHGGDLRGLTGDCASTTNGLARIKDLGFNAIAVSPPFVQRTVRGTGAAYDGSWPRDFTTVDPHLGNEADFSAFVGCAHGLGLKVILDAIVNDTADYIGLSRSSDYTDEPFRDCRGDRFDPARFVRSAHFPCLKAANMPKIPTLFGADRTAKKPSWLNDVTNYHDRGDVSPACEQACFEQGDLAGLDDLFTEKPAVVQGLADVYATWIQRFKIDGLRIEAARNVNKAFFTLWIPKLLAAARTAGISNFQLVGDVAGLSAVDLSDYVRARGLPTVLDGPMQGALTAFASGQAGPKAIATRLDADDYFQRNGVVATPATFLGNATIGRAAQQLRARSSGAGDLLKRDLLAHDLLFLLRGAPVVEYGDEVGMIGSGGGAAAGQDMFPTQVAGWRTEDRVGSPPIGTGSSIAEPQHPISQRLRVLGHLRDTLPALSTGASFVRYARGTVLAVSRIDANERREALAVFNADTAPATVSLKTSTPSAAWTALLGSASVSSDAKGAVSVTVPALSTLLLQANAQVPTRAPGAPRVRIKLDSASGFWRLGIAAVNGPVSVAFAVRREHGKAWIRVGVDDSPPYRAFVSPTTFKPGERVWVVAVARALNGSVAVSPALRFKPRP